MRLKPREGFKELTTCGVAVACAYEERFSQPFEIVNHPIINQYEDVDYKEGNKFIREYLPVKRKTYYKTVDRISFKDFLKTNKVKCIVFLNNHYVFVDGGSYWSFNDYNEELIYAVWELWDWKYV